MQLSLNWLQDFIKIPVGISPQKLGELLTLHTVEVEGVQSTGDNFDNIVVGKIVALALHPNADKLQLATVSDGKKTYGVVCGGSNLYEGMLVVFAKVGAKIRWHGEGELVKLEKATIRGETSAGMICAAVEVGLEYLFPAADERAVIDLQGDYTLGVNVASALGFDDVIYDIDNKSMTHRPDLWGVYGLARDVAAVLPSPLAPLPLRPLPRPHGRGGKTIRVAVRNKKLCPRYMVVAVSGVTVKPSSSVIQRRLIAGGLRPINNVVDITNYVMLELGQPTHAFDMSRILDIVVRTAHKGETLVTLDGQERKLDEDMLLITDGKKPVAIAGVMGGGNSEIDASTTDIVIESANFDAVSIRQTSQKLGLRTDASQRFEKSLDPALCETAIQRIVALLQESCPQAYVTSKVSDVKNFKAGRKSISLDVLWLQQKIGAAITKTEVVGILKRLGFEIKEVGGKQEVLKVTVPSWRATKDISIAEDLVEEVARVYGYNKIKPTMPLVSMQRPEVNKELVFKNKLKDILVQAGMTETYNYSFVNEKEVNALGFESKNYIKLANPLTNEHTLLRRNLKPNLLQNIVTNQRNFEVIKLFEIGNRFLNKPGELPKDNTKKEKLPEQEAMLGLVYAQKEKEPGSNFKSLKGVLEFLASSFGVEFKFVRNVKEALILLGDSPVGSLTTLPENTKKIVGLKTDVVICEIQLSQWFKTQRHKQYQPKNKFPYLVRDMAFVVDKEVVYNDIKEEIFAASSLVKGVEWFDEHYLNNGKKNLAVHITFGSEEKTLTGEEVDAVQKKISNALQSKYKAQLRDF